MDIGLFRLNRPAMETPQCQLTVSKHWLSRDFYDRILWEIKPKYLRDHARLSRRVLSSKASC